MIILFPVTIKAIHIWQQELSKTIILALLAHLKVILYNLQSCKYCSWKLIGEGTSKKIF